MELFGDIWNAVIIRPMINSLVILYYVFFNNFGIAIIIFTVAIRLVMVPLTIKQSRQMKAMSTLSPKLKEIQEKYKGDRQRTSQETMKIYREQGVNPLGCLGPMFIQLPIWIGLYRSIIQTLPTSPERLSDLARHLYSGLPQVHQVIPIDSDFLWLDLAQPDPSPIVLPILVGASMFLMQKMTTMPATSETQESTNRMMLWMMPIMFGFFTLQFPSGLALYWIVSNIIGIAIQGPITGWGPLENLIPLRGPQKPVVASALVPTAQEAEAHDGDRDDGEDTGGGDRNRPKRARRKSRRGRNKRRK